VVAEHRGEVLAPEPAPQPVPQPAPHPAPQPVPLPAQQAGPAEVETVEEQPV
jgi:hypothetical protein